jgi:hypothetical protein
MLESLDTSGAAIAAGAVHYVDMNKSFMRMVFNFSSLLVSSISKYRAFYSAWGGIMGFRRSFYKKVTLPTKLYRDDGFLYMLAKQRQYGYVSVPEASIGDVKNFREISMRKFINIQVRARSFPEVFKEFDNGLLEGELNIPLRVIVKCLLVCWLRHPIAGTAYLYAKLLSFIANKLFPKTAGELWRN